MVYLLPQTLLDRVLHGIEHFCFGGILCHAHRALDRQRIGAAMTDEHQSIYAKQGGCPLFAGVDHFSEGTQRGPDKSAPHFGG